jgi:hypothetical protein
VVWCFFGQCNGELFSTEFGRLSSYIAIAVPHVSFCLSILSHAIE